MAILSKLIDMTPKTFSDRWIQHSDTSRRLPNLRGYVQNHVVDVVPDAHPEPFKVDGISETWFQDENFMRSSYSSIVGESAHEDESRFLSGFSGYVVDNGALLEDVALPKVILVGSCLATQNRHSFGNFCADWCALMAQSVLGLRRTDTNFVSRIYYKDGLDHEPIDADVFITLRFATASDLIRAVKAPLFPSMKDKFSKLGVYVIEEHRIV